MPMRGTREREYVLVLKNTQNYYTPQTLIEDRS